MASPAVLLLGVLASCHGFNLDVEEPTVFHEDGAGFGHSMAQYGSSRVVVGAPLEVVAANQTGRLYECLYHTNTCQPISLFISSEAVNMSLGLSLAAASHPSRLLACGPTLHRACGENLYVKGSCLVLDSHLKIIQTVPAALPECPNQVMDIVFLIDGSTSIGGNDFDRMKDFVKAVMGQFEGTNVLFSLMQYSNLLETHFTFTEFQTSRNPRHLVDPIVQLKGLTFTATGIQKVVTDLFHRKNGARQGAKKILIVITDGQKYRDPLEYSDVVPQVERAGITCYAIGVGDAFQEPTARHELDTIGSAPPQEHVFRVDNFRALGSIQNELHEKIFAVEGTQLRTSSSFQQELSQEGFSSVLTRVSGPEGHPWSRFGAALTVLGDMNGDQMTDVAIGAPGEQENWGAVYLFHGVSGQGISSSYSQRITGTQFSLKLHYFGQSLSGGQDLTQDGLVDLAVGAQGHMLLLRSRPVLKIGVTIRFTPVEVAKVVYQCRDKGPVFPFEKNCGPDRLCEGDLRVDLRFAGLQTLVVGSSLELNVTVRVRNEGEDSYGTRINFYYPPGLFYRRVLGIQNQPHQHPLDLACETVHPGSEGFRSSSCSVNHPIFHEGSKGVFIVTFHVSPKATLGDKLLLRAHASSENNKPATNQTSAQLELPVKYMVYTVISRLEESTKYLNFSTSDGKVKKEAKHGYHVNNLSQRKVAVSIRFWVPILLNGVAVWDVVMTAPSQSLPCVSEREPPQHSDFLVKIPKSSTLDCSIAVCLRFQCDVPSFDIQHEFDFVLKGNLSFGWVRQMLQKKKVSVVSVAEITFNRSIYSQLPRQEAFLRAQMETTLEENKDYNPIPLLMGSSVGGILLLALIIATLYKLGFFRRQYKEMLNDKAEGTTAVRGQHLSREVPHPSLS
ncbi:integrin alpha-D [Echinops telfairi]|uniref:Integrin alpha-D n=1 Tax=Echinops telfairi TaxID=9371 RepID=A0ABM0ZR62_ECHTE|nr:integrin alpha-D [Echinops telfairi]